jgi:uncharacterized Zn-binding protein involved in type VI secretion
MSSAPMQAFGRVFNFMTSVEMALTAPLGKIPFPAFPAVAIGAAGFGLPHAHAHPPNLVPPAPPVPFPHATLLLSIPILSGAGNTMVAGKPAARCGDLGAEIWCGGYFPFCEIFLGSCNVWIEGARAARVGIDITKHCTFSSPKPSDPPMGPMVGVTLQPETNVWIGGVPLPSLTSLAIGAAFKAMFAGLGRAGRAIGRMRRVRALMRRRAAAYVDRMLKNKVLRLHGDPKFNRAARRDLIRMAQTRAGRECINDIARSGHHVDLHPPSAHPHFYPGKQFGGPYAFAHHGPNSALELVPNPHGAFQEVVRPPNQRPQLGPQRFDVRGTGSGSSSTIVYDPARSTNRHFASSGTPSDVILAHEMNHTRNNALGRRANMASMPDSNWQRQWQDLEEHNTVGFENRYRQERGALGRNRRDYTHLPSWGFW